MLSEASTADGTGLESGVSKWGTFKDSMRAPVHNWFAYPAGFSWKAVEYSLNRHNIGEGMSVYDPFAGTGTVPLTAKQLGVKAVGAEAHPFVCQTANVKLHWDLSESGVMSNARIAVDKAQKEARRISMESLQREMPSLILRCYEPHTLLELTALRNVLHTGDFNDGKDFLKLALTAILRPMSIADTGWPYISLKKVKKRPNGGSSAMDAFLLQVGKMLGDIRSVKYLYPRGEKIRAEVCCCDSRARKIVDDCSVDHIFTSPPYLNNIDYADRTRLEMFFWGMAKTWGELTQLVRKNLIVAATTQVSGRKKSRYALSADLRHDCPQAAARIGEVMENLAELRVRRAGKKDYDCMVGGYFSDIHLVLKNCYRALKPGGCAVFILGDSAPYGVHIPTDVLIGEIALSLGFSDYEVTVLRKRGGRWKSSPHTHGVPLRESAVELWKN